MAGDCYVGLISGTSIDALDAAVVEFPASGPRLLASHREPLPDSLRDQLRQLAHAEQVAVATLGECSCRFASTAAIAALEAIQHAGLEPNQVQAVGSHGQTVRHCPDAEQPFSLQIGDPATLAFVTGLVTVADFRTMDVAAGGQGAPLAPLFHQVIAPAHEACAIVNVGGIANVSLLKPGESVAAFDSGPGNCLIDAWMRREYAETMDRNGSLAARGTADDRLLELMLAHPYFQRPAPKSTGVETFNLAWVDSVLASLPHRPDSKDVVATLTRLTAVTIRNALTGTRLGNRVYICGGGAHNDTLLMQLRALLPDANSTDTAPLGIGPDWIEAAAFAWMARERLAGRPLNTPPVTGAARPLLLGAVYDPGLPAARSADLPRNLRLGQIPAKR